METTVALAVYRCYRSNALWFSARKDGYSITTNEGHSYSFDRGEMLQCALGWLDKSVPYWQRLLSAHAVNPSCIGMSSTNATVVQNVDSPQDIECICPNCTRAKLAQRG